MKRKNLIGKTASVALATGTMLEGAAWVNTTVVKAEVQTGKNTNSNKAVADLQTKADQAAHDLAEAKKADQTAQKNVSAAQEKLAQTQNDQTAKAQELEAAKKEQADKQTQADQDKAAADLQAEKAKNLQETADALQKEADNQKDQENPQKDLAEVTEEIKQANKELKEATTDKANCEDVIKTEQRNIAKKKKNIDARIQLVQKQNRIIECLTERMQIMKQDPAKDLSKVPKELEYLKEKINTIEEIQIEIENAGKVIHHAQHDEKMMENAIDILSTRVATFQRKKANAEQKISDLNKKIKALEEAAKNVGDAKEDKPSVSDAEVKKAKAAANAAKKEADRLADIYRASLAALEQAKLNVQEKQKAKAGADAAVTKVQQVLAEATTRQQNTKQALIAAQQANEAAELALQEAQGKAQESKDESTGTDDTTPETKDESTGTEDNIPVSKDESTGTDDITPETKDESTVTEDATPESKDESTGTEDNIPASKDESTGTDDIIPETKDESTQAQDDMPAKQETTHDYFDQIVTETINNFTPSAVENVVPADEIAPVVSEVPVTVNENPKSETEPVVNKNKTERYYVLAKTDRILQKLKSGRSVKYRHTASLRGKKNLHFVKITKHNRVYKILRKMKAGKKYQTLALKRVGKRYYAQIKLSTHKTAWINLKYVKFLKK